MQYLFKKLLLLFAHEKSIKLILYCDYIIFQIIDRYDIFYRKKFYGDDVFIGDLEDHLYSAIKTPPNLLFCEVHSINFIISLKMLKSICVKQAEHVCSARLTNVLHTKHGFVK